MTRLEKWISRLRARGIRAAHPDDGWVDRSTNRIHLAYSHYNDGLGVGDKLMLGRPGQRGRIVVITGRADGPLLKRWSFKPAPRS